MDTPDDLSKCSPISLYLNLYSFYLKKKSSNSHFFSESTNPTLHVFVYIVDARNQDLYCCDGLYARTFWATCFLGGPHRCWFNLLFFNMKLFLEYFTCGASRSFSCSRNECARVVLGILKDRNKV